MKKTTVYLDVSGASTASLHGGDSVNQSLRAHQLLTAELEKQGYAVKAASDIPQQPGADETGLLYAFHSHKKYTRYLNRPDLRLCAYYYLEPPVVKPAKYRALKHLSRHFNRVYIPNVDGVGYSLKDVDVSTLRQGIYPQAFGNKIDALWDKKDRKFLIMINANKYPASRKNELYGERLRAVVALARLDAIDLYGMGWRSWKKTGTYFWPFLSNRKTILSVYQGSVASKYEALSDYTFSMCFENMVMPGYITEKMFDCFFVGTIPVYLGAPDILDYVPENCFIDMRKFSSYQALHEYLSGLDADKVQEYRNNIQAYLNNEFQQQFSVKLFIDRIIEDVAECSKSPEAEYSSTDLESVR